MAKGRNVIGRFIERIYGQDGEHETLYLWRLKLLETRWGGLYFHVFHRGDLDPDPHDHPWEFWTLPLVAYRELVLDEETGETRNVPVDRFRWHHRPATHTHRVLGRQDKGKVVTLVWHGPGHQREWGFWVKKAEALEIMGATRLTLRGKRAFVPWRRYVFRDADRSCASCLHRSAGYQYCVVVKNCLAPTHPNWTPQKRKQGDDTSSTDER